MTYVTRLPVIHGNPTAGQGETPTRAELFAAAWLALLGDDANEMHRDERLVQAAQGQADFLAHNDFDARDPHLGYLGSTANERVEAAGYRLPWGAGNQVESTIRSWRTPQQAAATLTDHDTHRDHMRRRGFWRNHVVWGVGAAEAVIDRGGVFYVLVSAPVET